MSALPSFRLIQKLAGDADEHAVGERRLEARLCELVEHLGDGQPVVLPQVVEEAQSVVLRHTTGQVDASSVEQRCGKLTTLLRLVSSVRPPEP